MSATVHASAVLVGARAVLIRGPAGAGKSRLALEVIEAAAASRLPFARLVADDRTYIEPVHGRLLVRPSERLAGLIEVRGLGIRQLPHEPVAVAGWVVDLGIAAARMPAADDAMAVIEGVTLPRFAFTSCADALPVLLAALRTTSARGDLESGADSAVQHYRHGQEPPLRRAFE